LFLYLNTTFIYFDLASDELDPIPDFSAKRPKVRPLHT